MITSENIFEKGLLISLNLGTYQGRKKLSDDQLKDLPKEIVRGVHDLFDNDYQGKLKEVLSHDNKTRTLLKSMAVPFPIDGVCFILSTSLEGIIQFLKEREIGRQEIVTDVAKDYEAAKTTFKEKYPEYYYHAERSYPSQENFEKKFYFKYQLFKISKPEKDLEFITPEIYEMEMKKFKEEISMMKQEVVNIIYTELLEKTNRLKEQCTDGKPNQRTINNLEKFFTQVETVYKDFIDRKDIQDTIDKIKYMVSGISADSLRDNKSFKEKFRSTMKEAVETLKNLPDVELKRSLDF